MHFGKIDGRCMASPNQDVRIWRAVLDDSGKIDRLGMRLSCAMEKVPVAMEAEQISVSR